MECYDSNNYSLSNFAYISIIDHHHVIVSPYDKSLIKKIEKALRESNLEINPQINGDKIDVYFPQITEERRNNLIKVVNSLGEKAKIALRNIRRLIIKKINDLSLGENMINSYIKIVEKMISRFVDQVDNVISCKINELKILGT